MEWVKKWGGVGVLTLLGVVMIGYGVWEQIKPREVVVEIVKGNVEEEGEGVGEIMVDVAGAVEKGGVYKLSSKARVGDALVAAGGLSAEADRDWVAKNMNLAERVEDGTKVYVPTKAEGQSVSGEGKQVVVANEVVGTRININTASVSELDKLEGIGEVRAKAIVANRPYSKTEELVSKAGIPESVYEKISSKLSVY